VGNAYGPALAADNGGIAVKKLLRQLLSPFPFVAAREAEPPPESMSARRRRTDEVKVNPTPFLPKSRDRTC